ncbi:class I SAM-dependent methyltransferase [Magnetococcus sp. PR-3]|uniref:class I SAM-dependent methyltransferase n=1 Tax=Magnetococcus sp. PR-3 TaxID=3120355 RepID=UPI002FCE13F3
MATFKNHDFSWFAEREFAPGDEGKQANHNMLLYHLVKAQDNPTVLECGTAGGVSTCVLLTACEEQSGRLCSLDIDDCSDVATSEHWQFIQSDDRDFDHITAQAPYLKEGIDVLYLDSVHTRAHVWKLLQAWYPLVKEGGYIAFDDVDNTTYRKGGRTPHHERCLAFGDMAEMIKEFYFANLDDLFMAYHYGISGRAIMKKLTPIGSQPKPPMVTEDWPNPPGISESARNLMSAITRYIRVNLLP